MPATVIWRGPVTVTPVTPSQQDFIFILTRGYNPAKSAGNCLYPSHSGFTIYLPRVNNLMIQLHIITPCPIIYDMTAIRGKSCN